MARKLAGTLGRGVRGKAGWILALAIGLGVSGVGAAQEEVGRPPRVRSAVKLGQDAYKRGDYDNAARYFLQAQAGQTELTPVEQKDLTTFIQQNNIALEQRADGQGLLRKAEELAQQGQWQEANALVRSLHTNQYLTGPDRQKLGQLSERMRTAGLSRPQSSGPKGYPSDMPRGDAKSLLVGARAALQRGDLDTAESLAHQADRAQGGGLPGWMQPWHDSPAKVLRDVGKARAKQGMAVRPPVDPMGQPVERREPAGIFAPFKGIFGRGKDNTTGKTEGTKSVSAYPRPVTPLPLPPKNDVAPAAHAPQLPSPEKNEPTPPAPFPQPGRPPKTSGLDTAAGSVMPVTAEKNTPNLPPADARALARQLVQKGYRALEGNDLEAARKFAYEAKALRADLAFNEENPDRLLADIQRRAETGNSTAANTPPPPPSRSGAPGVSPSTDPRVLLRDARLQYQHGNLDEAERLCARAAAVPGARWGLFEDSPDRLRTDLLKARSKRDREESDRLMTEARKLFNQGYYHEAKVKAWKAKQLHGPYSVWDLGDRPDRLLSEIERAEVNRPKNQAPPLPPDNKTAQPKPALQTGKNNPESRQTSVQQVQAQANTKGPGVVPAHIPEGGKTTAPQAEQPKLTPAQVKARAAGLLAEARVLQKKGQLIEARHKAMEARKLEVIFGPDEDSPEMVLLSLAALCDRHIHTLLQQTGDKVTNANDAARFQKAEADLVQARKLAVAFGQDLGRIDQKAAWLKQAQGMPSGLAQVSDPPIFSGKPSPGGLPATPAEVEAVRRRETALDKLAKARLELKAGNTPLVRRLAEEAFLADESVRDEAAQLLRSVDAEEFNQSLLVSQRNAEAGVEAFKRRDYRQATEIFKSIDVRLLNPQLRAAVREIMSTPEMQPASIQHASAKVPLGNAEQQPGQVRVSDQTPPKEPVKTTQPGLTDQFRAMEEIQFQQFRDKGLLAQRTAMDQDRAGDTAKALDTLKEYLDALATCGLDVERVNLLRRPVENRMQQYRTLQAQRALEKEQKILLTNHSEAGRHKAIQKTQEEVAELMKQYQTFMKEGKYREAGLAAAKAKELDPDNVTADAAVRIATIQHNQVKWDKHKAENEEMFLGALDNKIGPYVDVSNPLKFDPNALDRVKNRKGSDPAIWPLQQNPAEKAIERRLSQPITINFKDLPMQQVLSDLSKMSNVNIVPDKSALQDAGVSLDQPLSLNVENVSLKSALNLLLQQVRLTYVIKDEVLQITTNENAKGKTKQRVYPVADLVVPIDNHSLPSVNSFHDALSRHMASQNTSMTYGTNTPYAPPFGLPNAQPVSSYSNSQGSGFAQTQTPGAGPQTSIHKQSPHGTMEELLINLIMNTVRPDSWSSVGGPGTIQYFPLGMALVINQTAEVQEEVQALLNTLRRLQDLEVAIEMKLVSVSEAFFEYMGVDFDINIRNSNARVEPQLMSGVFAPPGQINRLPNGFMSGLTPAGTFTPDLGIPLKSSSFDFSTPPFGGFPGTLGADGGLSLGLAFLSDIQVFMFMEAAQGDRRTNVMQAPKITVFNGQTAFIAVQDFQFFVTGMSLVNATGQAPIAFLPQNQAFPLGVNLSVTPVVSADRRFVRLNLSPSLTNMTSAIVPLFPVQIAVPQIFEGPGSGATSSGQPVIFQMFFQQPTFTQITLNTTVNVPDGGTVLLGGLKTLSEARNEYGPPILSKIPYLSRLFKNVGYGREAQSLMIMVTPRIIINEEEEQIYLGQLPPIPRP